MFEEMSNTKKYIVKKRVEGDDEWYYEGTWEDPVEMAKAVFNMGRYYSVVTDIKVEVQDI